MNESCWFLTHDLNFDCDLHYTLAKLETNNTMERRRSISDIEKLTDVTLIFIDYSVLTFFPCRKRVSSSGGLVLTVSFLRFR